VNNHLRRIHNSSESSYQPAADANIKPCILGYACANDVTAR
jgi:2-keto-4-pentenoate hydratase/2-oxohepta-3-ene-1,7-dioic acid hydratase in catechol pathway